MQPVSFPKRSVRFAALSLAFHIALCALVLTVSLRRPRLQNQVARNEIKFYPATLFIPGGAKVTPSPKPPGRVHHAAAHKPTAVLALSAKPAPPPGHIVASPHSAAGNGADAQSADPAFPIFSPRPSVTDRSLLPAFNRQVVVDVKVSAGGQVLQVTLVKGLGNGLDQIVLDTVKTWRFQPATINGSPVPTEAELIFPFDQDYPATPS